MHAGFSKADITPEPGLPMAGYINRSGRSIGAHDPLYARTLYLDDGGVELALIVLDIIRIDDELRERLIDILTVNQGLKQGNIFIAATHTHSGPEISLGPWSTREVAGEDRDKVRSYIEELSWKVNNSVSRAIERAGKVRFIGAASTIIEGVATNRVDRAGAVDKQAVVLRIMHGDEETIMVNYACHPTVLGPGNLLYTGDLAGLTVKHIEENIGVNAMYTNGAAGNISTRFSRSRQDFSEAYRLSRAVASPVINMLLADAASKLDEGISIRAKHLKVKLRQPVEEGKLGELREEYMEKLSKARGKGAPHGVIRSLESNAYATRIAERRNQLLRSIRSMNVELKALSIGGLTILFFPGELFVEYQLEVKEKAKPRKTMIVGYANGYIGYIPYPGYAGKPYYEEMVSLIDHGEYDKIRGALIELVEGE